MTHLPLTAALLLLTPAAPVYARDPAVMREFMRLHPCPSGRDVGSHTKCTGWQKDHIIPLECGGVDAIENLQWLTVRDHKAKTVHDNAQCRYLTEPNPLTPEQPARPISGH